MKLSEIFERGTFVRQRYRGMENQKPWPGLALIESFLKGVGLNQKLQTKISKLGDLCKQTSLFKRIIDGDLGTKPPIARRFFGNYFEKMLF